MNWLEDLISQHSEMETPINFWRWAGLVSISAVMKDQIWLSRGGAYNLYPNIYCILYADSGLKKGPATNLAKKLVKEVNSTKIPPPPPSIQAIIKPPPTAQSQPAATIQTKPHASTIPPQLSPTLPPHPPPLHILT